MPIASAGGIAATAAPCAIRLRAERAGPVNCAQMEKNKGARSQGRLKKGSSSERPPKDGAPKLSELGVSKRAFTTRSKSSRGNVKYLVW